MASSGNFCTLNPLTQPNSGTFSEGNLLFTHTSSAWRTTAGTHGMRTGKWYWEAYQYESLSGNGFPVGISDIDNGTFVATQASDYPDGSDARGGPAFSAYSNSGSNASKFHNGSETNLSFSIGVSGDVWQCALDLDNGKIWFGKNNSWDNSGDPANGSSPSYSGGQLSDSTTRTWVPITCSYNDSSSENFPQNFGQDSTFAGRITAGGNADENGFGDFKYAPPTGFLALCSANLPISADIDPAQTDDDFPGKNFNVLTYTGNSTTGQSLTGLGFKPDLIWAKMSSSSQNNQLYDSSRMNSRGTPTPFGLRSDTTGQEFDDQTEGNGNPIIASFDTDGFTLGTSGSGPNDSGRTYVAWCWRANGGTTASNSSGSITSTVQANQAAGFSIVTYAGNDGSWGSGNRDTFGHGLSAAPEFIIVKERNNTDQWTVFHAHVGNGGGSNAASNNLRLDNNEALYTNQSYKAFGATMPTSTLVTVEGNTTNSSGINHVAYCWHSVEGYSKFGSYVGNGNLNGPFVYTGFRPRLLAIKGISTTNNWTVFDTARETFNPIDKNLHWDTTDSEETSTDRQLDILSNGFKLRSENGLLNHPSGDEYVYMCWGDVSFKYNNTF